MRDEGTYLFESIEEFLNVIRKTGLRGTVSHLNVKYVNGVPVIAEGEHTLARSGRVLRHKA